MKLSMVLIAISALTLTACETPTTQRYSISADNNVTIRALGINGVGFSTFVAPPDFSSNCRALGPMQVADGLTHTQYIQRAFEDEFKIASAYAASGARVTLSGKVNKLEFSSTRAITGGSWAIALQLSSSNGKTLTVDEYYEFNSGFAAFEACRNTAEAFSRAVQNLVGKTVRHTRFAELVR
jgi:uncharacterized lipoprotein YmbA